MKGYWPRLSWCGLLMIALGVAAQAQTPAQNRTAAKAVALAAFQKHCGPAFDAHIAATPGAVRAREWKAAEALFVSMLRQHLADEMVEVRRGNPATPAKALWLCQVSEARQQQRLRG